MHRHEIDGLRRRLLRRHDKVAFIFAVRVVGHDHDLAGRDIAHDLVDCVELQGYRNFRDHPLTITSASFMGKCV